MSIALRADASRAVVVLDGVDRVAFNEDGSMELLTPAAGTPDANDVPTFGNSLTSGAAVNTTSGTSHNFTGIPSWAKRITVMLSGVSTNGTSNHQIQIGSASIDNAGYVGGVCQGTTGTALSAGFLVYTSPVAAASYHGLAVLTLVSGNTWVCSSTVGSSVGGTTTVGGGTKNLSGTLGRIRLTTVNGTDVFDAGAVNIMWE